MNGPATLRAWLVASWMLVACFLAVFFIDATGLLAAKPFRHVNVEEVRWQDDGKLFLHVTYERTDYCPGGYRAGIPYAVLPGADEALDYTPIRADSQSEQRLWGSQHMRWVVDPARATVPFDKIEVRTRYRCRPDSAPRYEDFLMLRVEVPDR